MHRDDERGRLSDRRGRMCPVINSVADFVIGLAVGAVGRPESPQGAELKQGLEFTENGSFLGLGIGERALAFRGPQQHVAWRHFGPQPQCWACSAASKPDVEVIDEATLALPHAKPKRNTAARPNQRSGFIGRIFRCVVSTSTSLQRRDSEA